MMNNEERRKATEWFRNRAKNCPMSGSRRMYEIATEALEEHERNEQPRWIPVTERLPEPDTNVLVRSGSFVSVWSLREDDVYWEDEYSYFHDMCEVTHWMPLPKPPDHIGEANEMVEKESES